MRVFIPLLALVISLPSFSMICLVNYESKDDGEFYTLGVLSRNNKKNYTLTANELLFTAEPLSTRGILILRVTPEGKEHSHFTLAHARTFQPTEKTGLAVLDTTIEGQRYIFNCDGESH